MSSERRGDLRSDEERAAAQERQARMAEMFRQQTAAEVGPAVEEHGLQQAKQAAAEARQEQVRRLEQAIKEAKDQKAKDELIEAAKDLVDKKFKEVDDERKAA